LVIIPSWRRCLEEPEEVVYFAFTYPYTYLELQQDLGRMEDQHGNGSLSYAALQQLPDTDIYFHRSPGELQRKFRKSCL
jgi:hypothetical protein